MTLSNKEFIFSRCFDVVQEKEATKDIVEVGHRIVVLFNTGVDFLRKSSMMPNPAINKLMMLFWNLVGNKITPTAVTKIESLHFWTERKGEQSIGIILVPENWPEMCEKDQIMQLGGLIFVASQACDYFHKKISSDGNFVNRARAYEAEFLRMLPKDFELNEYQTKILSMYPQGLQSLPKGLLYEISSFQQIPSCN